MLVIRMQRTGRKGYAHFRAVVQDSRQTPTSGKTIASLGSYNPHTKESTIDYEKLAVYLNNGAQPSDRIVRLMMANKVDMPDWVKKPDMKKSKTKNMEKLRKNAPKEEPAAEEPVAAA